MTRDDKHSTIPKKLLGLSADETREFLRLERLLSDSNDSAPALSPAKPALSPAEERRWLELFEKKHSAAMQPFLTAKGS